MRVAGDTIGTRGITLLAVVGVAGMMLAVHGWSGRHHGTGPGLGPAAAGPAASASGHPAAPARGASPPTQGPPSHPSPGASGSSASAAPTPGPKLSAQSYASYSFRVWPPPEGSAAKAAATGLAITVRRHGSGIMVTAAVAGQPPPPARFYPTGAAVYVVEATMGDDSGNADYNLGDDGLIVTDAQGRILQ
jgi:hypothetical protein